MVQPKNPPLGIRPKPELVAKIDAYAKRHGMTRHAAILALIERGLAKKGAENGD